MVDVELYIGLVSDVVDNYMKWRNIKWDKSLKEDLVSEGYLALLKAAKTYDPDRGVKFHTYASNRIRAELRSYIRKLMKTSTRESYIEDIGFDKFFTEDEVVERDFDLVDKYEPEGEMDRRIYHEILMGTATRKSIAEDFGVNTNVIKCKRKRLVKRIKKQMEKDGYEY